MSIRQKITPRKMNWDSENRLIKTEEGEVRYILNCRSGRSETGSIGIIENLMGNTEVNFTLPSGTNTCIGTHCDPNESSIFYFVHNDSGNHGIYRFFPGRQSSRIETIAIDPIFDFDKNMWIKGTKSVFVDNKILKWTDAYNPSRSLDVNKAAGLEPKEWKLYSKFDSIITLSVLDGQGNIIQQSVGGSIDTPMIVTDRWNNFSDVRAEWCGDYIHLTMNQVNDYSIEFYDLDAHSIAIPENFMTGPFIEQQIDGAVHPPRCNPTFSYETDSSVNYNYLKEGLFQFRSRYIYKDGAKSTWSKWSSLAYRPNDCAESEYNCISIDYSDVLLNDIRSLELIESVELGFREGNDGNLKSLSVVSANDFAIQPIFKFYNNGMYSAQAEVDNLKLYEDKPLTNSTITYADGRIIEGDLVEGYDKPCTNMEVVPSFTQSESSDRFTITARVLIWNREADGAYNDADIGDTRELYGPIAQHGSDAHPSFGGVRNDAVGVGVLVKDNAGTMYEQYLPEAGFCVYLAGTPYYGISRQIEIPTLPQLPNGAIDLSSGTSALETFYQQNAPSGDGSYQPIYSTVEIRNVPKGKYVLRVASHWCSKGDQLGKGSMYDLDGSQYQATSTYLKAIDDQINGVDRRSEAVIDLDQDVHLGDIIIEDLVGLASSAQRSKSGYLIDAEGVTNFEVLGDSGVFVENQTVRFYRDSASGWVSSRDCYTDHNGFFFIGHLPQATNGRVRVLNYNSEIHAQTDMVYWSDSALKALEEQTQFASPPANDGQFPYNNETIGHGELLIPVTDLQFRSTKSANIIGNVIDSNGNGIEGVLVVQEQNGRQEPTDSTGGYSILAFAHGILPTATIDGIAIGSISTPLANGSNRVGDDLVLAHSGKCPVLFDSGNNPTPADMNSFGSDLTVADIIVTVDDLLLRSELKKGGMYWVGMFYLDRANRSCTVSVADPVYVPFWTEQVNNTFPLLAPAGQQADGTFDFQLNVKHTPPIWATHAYLVRSKNILTQSYIQTVANDVKYVQAYNDALGTVNEVTSNFSQANEIYLDIQGSITNFHNSNTNSKLGYTFTEGDRLRLLRRDTGSLFESYFDVPIKGTRVLDESNWIAIENLDTFGELKPGVLVEIYTPKNNTEDKVFYEIGECIEIENPYTEIRQHKGAINGELLIDIDTFDTYKRDRGVSLSPEEGVQGYIVYPAESPSVSDFFLSEHSDIGRINTDSDDIGQRHRPGALRYSGKYISNTKVNNLGQFDNENIVEEGNEFGRILITDVFANVLLIVQEQKSGSRYINKILAQQGGGVIQLQGDEFLSKPHYFSGEYGCLNAESYSRHRSQAIWFDRQHGVVCRYAPQNGVTNISGYDERYNKSYNMEKFFEGKSDEHLQLQNFARVLSKVVTEYDLANKEWVMSFLPATVQVVDGNTEIIYFEGSGANIGDRDLQFATIGMHTPLDETLEIPGATLSFSVPDDGWNKFESYQPEMIARVNNTFVSFKAGALWVHNTNEIRNRFYNVEYDSEIKIVGNKHPSVSKVWTNINLESTDPWEAPEQGDIRIPQSGLVPVGQESLLSLLHFTYADRIYTAGFWADMNTPGVTDPLFNGFPLRGESIEIDLKTSSTTHVKLFAINLFAIPSEVING